LKTVINTQIYFSKRSKKLHKSLYYHSWWFDVHWFLTKFVVLFWKVGNSIKNEGADYALESIHNVKQEIPEIWIETTKYRGRDKFGRSINRVNSIEATPVVA